MTGATSEYEEWREQLPDYAGTEDNGNQLYNVTSRNGKGP